MPIACRTRRALHLAGSQGCAGTAATAETDVAIQRYSTSSATLRFAAAADPATFAAADETALEPADTPGVVAPATLAATLAHVGFALAGLLAA